MVVPSDRTWICGAETGRAGLGVQGAILGAARRCKTPDQDHQWDCVETTAQLLSTHNNNNAFTTKPLNSPNPTLKQQLTESLCPKLQ